MRLRLAVALALVAGASIAHAAEPPAPASAPKPAAAPSAPPPALPPLPHGLPPEEFAGVKGQVSPMSPEQIRELKKWVDKVLEAEEAPARPPPKPVSYSLNVSLAPGEAPPAIRTATRFVSSIVFVDSQGAPWPVAGWSLGDEKRFDVVQGVKGSNVLTVTPKRDYAHASLAVFLQDSPTPVSLVLLSGQKEVDTRVDLKLQGRGPKATDPVLVRQAEGDQNLMAFLDGVVPDGAKALKVQGGNAEAWVFAKRMYLKTRLPIISPAWRDSISSSDGTTVYVMPEATMVLASQNGRVVNLRLTGL